MNLAHNKNDNFFDPRTLLAIVLVFASIFGWQYYLSKKYPAPQTVEQTEKSIEKNLETIPTHSETAVPLQAKQGEITPVGQEQIIAFQSEPFSFEVTSRGMGLKNIKLNQFRERDGTEVFVSQGTTDNYLNELKIDGVPVFFNLEKISETQFKGVARVGTNQITRTYEIDPVMHTVSSVIEMTEAPGTMELMLTEGLVKDKSTSFLMPSFDFESVFVAHSGTTEIANIDPEEAQIFEEAFNNVSIASIGKHYFTTAIIDESDIAPMFSAKVDVNKSVATGSLKYVQSQGAVKKFVSKTFIGPKELKLLQKVDNRLGEIINFGMFAIIAKPILMLLKFLYTIVGNYGVAIIIVTLLIRMLLLPLNISSYRSMKKMQVIQPLLKSLKEKYKADPKQLQLETMALMKREKVNPIGGCLPMLLQLPIFIALYNVLAQSIELYQAPFMLWIMDLSLKDPYYVLPVLMGVTMFIQQKITPTTMDPAQAKAMQIMPVIFSLMMISLPSGLTLYIFVSTLFGIIQQYLIMKDKSGAGERVGVVTKLN